MADHGQQGGDDKTVNPIQVQKFLQGLDYPASKEQIVDKARQQDAGDDVIQTLQRMPDQQYGSPVDISQAIGKES